MRLSTTVAGLVAGIAGLAGAVAGYQQLAASPRHSETVQVSTESSTTKPATPAVRTRLRDCPRGFDRRGRGCVRVVERTVVVDVRPAARSSAPVAARRSDVPVTHDSAGDPATHDAGDDHGGRRGESREGTTDQTRDETGDDHGSDDHGSDDGGHNGEGEDGHHGGDEPDDD